MYFMTPLSRGLALYKILNPPEFQKEKPCCVLGHDACYSATCTRVGMVIVHFDAGSLLAVRIRQLSQLSMTPALARLLASSGEPNTTRCAALYHARPTMT